MPQVPALDAFEQVTEPTAEGREISTTMAFVRVLTALVRDKNIGKHVVPIVPDEARTFGMEGMFRQLGIYSSEGQKYTPDDKDQVMYYREDKSGQILEEGINEAGAFCSWIAAATSYSVNERRDRARSTSSTRCSACSGSATSRGPPATSARAASCSAVPRAARR